MFFHDFHQSFYQKTDYQLNTKKEERLKKNLLILIVLDKEIILRMDFFLLRFFEIMSLNSNILGQKKLKMKQELEVDEKDKNTSVKITYSMTRMSFETSGLNAEDTMEIFQKAFGRKLVGVMLVLALCLLLFWFLGQPKWLLELF